MKIPNDMHSSSRTCHLHRAAESVLRKITHVFALKENQLNFSAGTAEYFHTKLNTQWQNARWIKQRDACMNQCAVNNEASAALDSVARDALEEYCRAFNTRRHVMDKLSSATSGAQQKNPYLRYRVGRALVDVYVNHLTNLTEARFRDCGLDVWSAHTLNGFVIGQAVTMWRGHDTEMAFVNPQQPQRPSFDSELDAQMSELKGYWQILTRQSIAPVVLEHYRR